eukprot:TRINITY_DN16504_c2_g1_i1.p1 TRINITY_DN16504_c2_g1~~TRINITY_DN16504_c2_g1_i1.p1  ORF type:complete len:509 (+),score=47.73 TRINITY_DN16504_c2_g1_i1:72-1598(+)
MLWQQQPTYGYPGLPPPPLQAQQPPQQQWGAAAAAGPAPGWLAPGAPRASEVHFFHEQHPWMAPAPPPPPAAGLGAAVGPGAADWAAAVLPDTERAAGPHGAAAGSAASPVAGASPAGAAWCSGVRETARERRHCSAGVAALSVLCAYDPRDGLVAPAPELGPLGVWGLPRDCSEGGAHTALVTAQGLVLSAGENSRGQLGSGDQAPRAALTASRLPWPAAAVRCGNRFSVALRRGGTAVCRWGLLERFEGVEVPTELGGLPAGDPVVLLEAGSTFCIMVTASGNVYGCGSNIQLCIGTGFTEVPKHSESLSKLRLRRLACAVDFAVGEASCGAVAIWGNHMRLGPTTLPCTMRWSYPLLSLAAGGRVVAAADSMGNLWSVDGSSGSCQKAPLPAGVRAVRVAVARSIIVALSADGRLWNCAQGGSCRSIHAANPGLPLGLLPCGGVAARRFVLIPNPSCGYHRCRLLLLAAGRRVLLPGGEMQRAALIPFLIEEEYLFDKPDPDESP